ncbi:hypothetical protein CW304_04300 [Bacillus sp. UFRGS-B20]|nr:hypothetical protein CW304_04300 [Bacillus sp. UFRGS-B20]
MNLAGLGFLVDLIPCGTLSLRLLRCSLPLDLEFLSGPWIPCGLGAGRPTSPCGPGPWEALPPFPLRSFGIPCRTLGPLIPVGAALDLLSPCWSLKFLGPCAPFPRLLLWILVTFE